MAAAGAVTATAGSTVTEVYARDAMIAWFRGEFAAANAIIDELCGHLAQIGDGEEYEAVFAAIHRRRLNWIPVLHMQKFYSIADVAAELRLVTANRSALSFATHADEPGRTNQSEATPEADIKQAELGAVEAAPEEEPAAAEAAVEGATVAVEEEAAAAEISSGDSSDRKVIEDGEPNGGIQEEQASLEKVNVCADHEDGVVVRPERIKILKGFMAKESVKGHMVNVVKGLKLYEDVLADSELLGLVEFINELRLAGHRGELSGETFILFNQQMKGNKREIIQLGVPIFQSTTEEAASNIEPIPTALQTVIDHLVQWRLIPEGRKPNSCIINFFDEDEHSQPYFKPPHLDNPISTLFLSETTMAFGRSLIGDHEGNYKGSLTLPLKEGSLLVMRGNSADMARHVICSSPNRRVIITFVKVRAANHQVESPTTLQPTKAVTLWQPGAPPSPQKAVAPPTAGGVIAWPHGMVPVPGTWGLALSSPVVMLAPRKAVVAVNPGKKGPRNGTGVFLPWAVGPKKYNKHLPPRFQKGRPPSLPSPIEAHA